MNENCIFCKIADGLIPASVAHEDAEFVAFHDLNKQAPVHVLVIPRAHYDSLLDVTDGGLLGRSLSFAAEVARKLNLGDSGFRLVINTRDDGGQTIHHLHIHILGGRFMSWPPG